MPKLEPEYELVLMLDPEVPDERRDEITGEARRRIESGGTLKQERSWGLRKMAYEIQRRNEADYRFFRFEKGDSILDELNHNLKITDGVLRYRIFKVDPRAPVVDPPPPFSLEASGDRPGGRGRRDDRGGRSDDRPPRAPDPEPEAPAGEPAPAAAAPEAEAPAAPEAEAPQAEAPATPEAPAPEASEPEPPAPEAAPEPEAQATEAPAADAPDGADSAPAGEEQDPS